MLRRVWCVVCALSLLTACGGGSGGGNGGPTNAPPSIDQQSFTGLEDQPLSAAITAVDPGDTLAFTVTKAPINGDLSQISSSGAFSYTPAADFNGTDSFEIQVRDSAGQTATATISVILQPVNDTPVAASDIFEVDSAHALEVLANDTDIDDEALSVELIGTPLVGTAIANSDGTIDVALPPGFKGFTRFDYRIRDAAGVTSEAAAQVFVGVAPFKLVYFGTPLDGRATGLYVNDLFVDTPLDPGRENGSYQKVRVAQDGSALAFEIMSLEGQEVWYAELDDPSRRALLTGEVASGQRVDDFVVSPDGRYVALVVRTPRTPVDERELYLFDREDGAIERVGLSTTEHLAMQEPRFNGSTTALYYIGYTGFPGTSAVYRADLETGELVRASPEFSGDTGWNYMSWWFAPDDSRLVHMRSHGGALYSLWVNDTSSPDQEARLHENFTGPETPFYPVISPDGLKTVFTTLYSETQTHALVAETASPGTAHGIGPSEFQAGIDPMTFAGLVSFRADSHALLTASCGYEDGGVCNLYEIALADLINPIRVNPQLSEGQSIIVGKYSNDGERISYVLEADGSRELWTVRRSMIGTNATRVSPAAAYLNSHMFDPSGTVAFILATENLISAPLSLVNLDAPDARLPIAATVGSFSLNMVVPRRED